jgi:hypothetical protein
MKLNLASVLMILCTACGGGSTSPAQPAWVELASTIAADELPQFDAARDVEPPVTMRLAEAQAALPFMFGLPTWTPEGFVLQEDVEVTLPSEASSYTAIIVTWQDADDGIVTLQAYPVIVDEVRLAGAGRREAAQVNGQAATFVRSGGTGRLALRWEVGGVNYILAADTGSISKEALIRMAESVQ